MLCIVSFAIIITFTTGSCTLSRCHNAPQNRAKSPNGQQIGVVFERDCGATTSPSTQVSILKSGKTLGDQSGNIYVVEGSANRSGVTLLWESDNQLIIREPKVGKQLRIFKKKSAFDKVSVKYLPQLND